MTKRVLLIDGDVLAYRAAASCEKAVNWGNGFWTWHVEWDDVLSSFDHQLDKIVEDLEADSFKLCLTDSDGNFRKGVYRSYKGKRGNTKKPLVLAPFKEYLIAERDAYFRPGLEGDDCMGILATRSNPENEERIIVSIDKDMKTIPGLYYNDAKPDEGVITVSEEDADLWFLTQTLTGDVTDGYPGCPGIGKVKAERLLADNPDPWASIVAAYEKAGLLTSEDEFLKQLNYRSAVRAQAWREAYEQGLWRDPKAMGALVAQRLDESVDAASGAAKNAEALERARTATFTNSLATQTHGGAGDGNGWQSMGEFFQNMGNTHPGFRMIVPFVRAPTNITRFVWNRTPGLNLMRKQVQNDLMGKNGPKARADAAAQMATGAVMWGAAAAAAYSGVITGGGPKDREIIKMQKETGWLPYSADRQNHYMLMHQLTRITRDRGSLVQDDRLDALSMAVGFWAENMARDADKARDDLLERKRDEELRKFMESFNGRVSSGPSWISL